MEELKYEDFPDFPDVYASDGDYEKLEIESPKIFAMFNEAIKNGTAEHIGNVITKRIDGKICEVICESVPKKDYIKI